MITLSLIFSGISVASAIIAIILAIHAKKHARDAQDHARDAIYHAQKAQELSDRIKSKTPKRKIEEF